MTPDEAAALVLAWHNKRKGDDMYQSRGQGIGLTSGGRWFRDKLLPYDYDEAETQLFAVLHGSGFPRPGTVIDNLKGTLGADTSSADALTAFEDGDVVESFQHLGIVEKRPDMGLYKVHLLNAAVPHTRNLKYWTVAAGTIPQQMAKCSRDATLKYLELWRGAKFYTCFWPWDVVARSWAKLGGEPEESERKGREAVRLAEIRAGKARRGGRVTEAF